MTTRSSTSPGETAQAGDGIIGRWISPTKPGWRPLGGRNWTWWIGGRDRSIGSGFVFKGRHAW